MISNRIEKYQFSTSRNNWLIHNFDQYTRFAETYSFNYQKDTTGGVLEKW